MQPDGLLEAIARVIALLTQWVNENGLQAAINAVNDVLG
jgi:hypothetical protein